jgi:hypothetical protein
LSSFTPEEWLELLTTLHAQNAIFGERFLRAACDSLDSIFWESLSKILLDSESYLDSSFIIEASQEVLEFAAENELSLFFSKNDFLSRLVEHASQKNDLKTMKTIMKISSSLLHSNTSMLKLIANNIDLFKKEEISKFLAFSYSKDYPGKEILLTKIFEATDEMDVLSLEAVVAGLLQVGSEKSIQLVFDLANHINSGDVREGAIFRGIALGLTENNSKKIHSLNWTNTIVKVLLDTLSRSS